MFATVPRALLLQRAEVLAFYGLLATLIWAPLPLGSGRTWSIALLAIVLCGLLTLVWLAAVWAAQAPGAERAVSRYAAAGPLLLLASYAALVAAQLVPWPPLATGGAAAEKAVALSVDPFATRQYLMLTLACLAAFFLTTLLVREERRVRLFMLAVVASGVAQAALAIVLFGARVDYQLLFMPFSSGRATGTFANADHLAGYMEMCISLGLGLMLANMGAGARLARGWRERLVALLQFTMSKKMVVRLLLILMVMALVMTRSRMGNAALLCSLLLTGCICAVKSRQLRRTALWLVVSLLVVDVVVIGQWIGLEQVIARIEATSAERAATPVAGDVATPRPQQREESIEERLQAARYALRMLPERPWFGFGGGTFYTAFAPFKGEHPLGFYDHAHNDYVEIAADTGLLGLGLLAAVVGLALWRALHAMGDNRPAQTRGMAVGIFMAICCLALHSTVDFNLQIPANALTFTVILALAWCMPSRGRRPLLRQRNVER